MRVFQAHNRYRQSGGEDSVVDLEASVLRKGGHHVGQFLVDNQEAGIQGARDQLMGVWNPLSAKALTRAVDQFEADVAHIHNTWYSLTPSVVSALGRSEVPTVMTLHNYRLACVNAFLFRDQAPCVECVGRSPWRGVQHQCYRDSYAASLVSALSIVVNRRADTWKHVDLFLVPSWFGRDVFIAGGIDESRLRVKRHFRPDPGERLQSPSQSDTVLFVGRISPEKGLHFLARAWAAASPHGLRLRVIGEVSAGGQNPFDGIDDVEHVGPLPQADVQAEMKRARALLIPSQWFEVHPLVLLEGLAAGLPIVASNLPAMNELLEPLGPDWLPRSGDMNQWTEALKRLGDNALVDQAGMDARRTYEDGYTEERGLAELEAVYDAVRDGRS